jgi:hypothetical protein
MIPTKPEAKNTSGHRLTQQSQVSLLPSKLQLCFNSYAILKTQIHASDKARHSNSVKVPS